MSAIEKVAYLKGLAEGLGLDEANKQDKLLMAIIDVLDEMALDVADLGDDLVDLADEVDAIDEDLGDLEDFLFEDDGLDEYGEVKCPSCEEMIFLDSEMLDEVGIDCPACGVELEFDFSCDCDDEDCDCE